MRTIFATAIALTVIMAAPAAAQNNSPFVEFRALKPEFALKAAKAALQFCRDEGYQVGVTVVDRAGTPQVFIRDRFAGAHVYETAYRKAWTAASFGISTGELANATRPGEPTQAIRHLDTALPLGGGLVIEAGDGSTVGAIGVSGAPSPNLDADCARKGIEAIEFDIAF